MHIVIIGNGISGISAARHIRKNSDAKITVISGETDYFFSRTALMYVFMGQLKFEHTKPYEDWFWAKNKIELKKAWVKNIDFKNKKIQFQDPSEELFYDKLIIATGSKPNKIGCKGQDLKGVQGLYSYQDLENLEENTKNAQKAVVIGGGLIGIELTEMLISRGIHVTFLVRENSFWRNVLPQEESELITRYIKAHGIDLQLNEEVKEIVGNKDNIVNKVITKLGKSIECQVVGLTNGVIPNINFLRNSALEINQGILVNEYLETNISDVYAIGDCVEHRTPLPNRKAIEQIWYTGRIMGETVAQTIYEKPTKYSPSIFFNSAKFFDIEYQTYGNVPSILPKGVQTFYWQHQSGKICFRVNFSEKTQAILGINTFGIRMKHEVWDEWIREGKSISYAIENFKQANFNPEFFKNHEKEILEKYNFTFGKKLTSNTKKTIWQRLF